MAIIKVSLEISREAVSENVLAWQLATFDDKVSVAMELPISYDAIAKIFILICTLLNITSLHVDLTSCSWVEQALFSSLFLSQSSILNIRKILRVCE